MDTEMEYSLEERTLGSVIVRQASRYGDKPLLTSVDGGALSYAELEEDTNRIAHGVADLGIEHQEPVLVMLPSTMDYMRIWCGLSKRGAIEVPVNLAYRGRILTHIVNDSKASTIIVDRQFLDRLEDIADDLEHLERCVIYSKDPAERENLELPTKLAARCSVKRFADLFSEDASPFEPGPAFHDLTLILYTSGTTGPSKGVMISHAQIFIESSIYAKEQLDLGPDDVVYSAGAAFFHVMGKDMFYSTLISGCSAILRESYKNDDFWPDIEEHGCTAVALVGAPANWLWQQPESPDDAKTPLRKVALYPVVPDHEAFAKRFGVEISTGYSQTECVISLIHPLGKSLPSSRCVGRPRKGVEVKILDKQDRERPVGELGEICVRSENSWELMVGYWGRPDATAKAFRNLWYHSGDAGYQDAEGRFYFVDRLTDSMRRRGENISSMEVEEAVQSHPQVLECAVFPVAADESEQEVMTTITPNPGEQIDPEELTRYLNRLMPHFMVPRYIDFAGELPKTPSGKIQKFPLREKGVTEGTWDRVAAGVKLEK